ncbi:reverse transcriptase domain, Zinc finger, CCHC-type [Artemisia annua]|uniref:Reverse transcriptase domain, Zinc finger, CCHC-type n=1 Tax=Artemisia annua TaxID=35608 RepID=A0A2U1LUD1_ARTAN|nr:reverse transcriptase domain, Zinc finger, CCHC-type [Artemisia annua]
MASPMKYLGVPIGCNMARCSNWSAITQKFSCKLTLWRAPLLSAGDRMSLIKSLDLNKKCPVKNRLPLHVSSPGFRRQPCGGAEMTQLLDLQSKIGEVVLSDQGDAW